VKLTPLRRPCVNATLVAVVLVGAAGCRDIDGGSIEASWIINTAGGGKRIGCACARFGAVRYSVLEINTGARPCEAGGGRDAGAGGADPRCEFDCVAGVGTTDFFIPPGEYAVSLVPVDLSGKALGPDDGTAVPAPANRSVRSGEVTNLGVHLIAAEEARLAGPSACEQDVLEP